MNKFRITGLLYLAIAIIGPFSILYVPSIILRETAIETYNLLQANIGLYKMGIVADVFVIGLELFLVSFIYKIFKSVDKKVSLIAVIFRLLMIVIMIINVVLSISILTNDPEGVLRLFGLHERLTLVWGIVFGGHLFALAHLIYRHERMPKYLPYAVVIGAFGYVLDGLGAFGLTFSITMVPLMIGVIGEFWFMFWLIFTKEKAAH